MKVSFITYQYPPKFWWGGAFYAYRLTRCLEDMGVDLVRIGPPHMPDDGIKIPAMNLLHFAWKARGYVGDADVVHGNILADLFVTGKPCVTTLHHPIRNDYVGNSPKKMFFQFWERRCCKKAKAVITDSLTSMKEFRKIYGWDKFYSIPLGVDRVSNAKFGDPTKVLCAVGMGPRKGISIMLDVARCLAEYPVEFYVTGEGEERRYLESLATDMKLKNVHFLGVVEKEKLEELYRECGVCVIPSIYEGFSLPILEGMAHKKAVITTNVGVASEVVENGRNGFVVEKRDPALIASIIRRCIEDEKLFRRVAQNGLLTSRKLTWENTAKKTIQIYEKVLAGNS